MPVLTPSYLYTFVALLAVSTLLVLSFMAFSNTLRASSEARQLENLMDAVAAESTKLLTLALASKASTETYIQMPATIGNRQYWLQLHNDSARTWLEGGFGNSPMGESDLRVCLPSGASAIGHFVGGYGAAHLECEVKSNIVQIRLTSSSLGD
jgi:hypothetical protein